MRGLDRPPALVIFDCDGVLVDSERPMHEELRALLAEHGLDLSLAACLDAFMGLSIDALLHSARNMGAELPADFRSRLYARVHARLARGTNLIPGVADLIARLRATGIPMCVASNGSEAKMELMLEQHGLWTQFRDHCYSAQTLGVAKPDPRLLQTALHGSGVSAAQAVVIEDSVTGIESSRRAGVTCLHFAPAERAVEGVLRFETMAEIGDVILCNGRGR